MGTMIMRMKVVDSISSTRAGTACCFLECRAELIPPGNSYCGIHNPACVVKVRASFLACAYGEATLKSSVSALQQMVL